MESEPKVILQFTSPTCQPCKALTPLVAVAAGKHPDRIYMDIDVTDDPTVIAEWGIAGVPTVVRLSADGEEIGPRGIGPSAASALI